MAQDAANHAKCARGKVYAPHLGNQWQQSGTHFSVVTGRNWPTAAPWMEISGELTLSRPSAVLRERQPTGSSIIRSCQ
jgi:hypothetical protein